MSTATILDEEDTIEAHALSTSLDPYGQLLKMLVPRALGIGIYDRMGVPLWLSDGCEGPDVPQLVEEALNAARAGKLDPSQRDGFTRSWTGETTYIFILRAPQTPLGAVTLTCQDGSSGPRPFSFVQGLLRPALQVLGRELLHQGTIEDLRKEAAKSSAPKEPAQPTRENDLRLMLEASGADGDTHSGDLQELLRTCIAQLGCTVGALLVPDRRIELSCAAPGLTASRDALEKAQRHLLAWVQVQRRTLILNRTPANNPLGTLPHKILACPIRDRAQHVIGVLVLFKAADAADFDLRQVRTVEMMARHTAYVLQNTYDPATGLLTRPAFEQHAFATLAGALSGREHCVAYADVDGLHAINENHGMHVGDLALVRIAETIREHLTPNVVAARLAGDRFALFFSGEGEDGARAFLEHLCARIAAAEFVHQGTRLELSMSVGLSPVTDTKLPLSHALASAEEACRRAKSQGRGQVALYEGNERSSRPPRVEDLSILGNVREALANDRFRMEAQPIAALGAGTQSHRFELLLRMLDPSGATVAPEKFLAAAERNGLACEIDRWVVQYALEILSSAAALLDHLDAHFTINISGQALGESTFPAFLEQKLSEYGLPSTLLSFEIAESAAVANIVAAESLIGRLREFGHEIALDDFGRGLSSLGYLKSLSASHLKIDGALIRELTTSTHARSAVAAIVSLARETGLKTTAESVESEALLEAVRELGVDYAQGFVIGRPRPLEIVLQELLSPGPARSRGAGAAARLRP
ncbi:MAG TPA: EAL domain-containing protein [Steroidobacter sp.]